jgi:diaminohydroxyphosphoribosylaminopyrimidine deaminase/5-amino-6-(5-phosphoribosylamino)uracil reductase
VLAAPGASPRRRRALEAAGVRVLAVPKRGRHLDLRRALALLGREGLNTLLVEGGGGLAAALLRARLVDEVHWFAAPTWLGEEGRPALGALGLERLGSRPVLADSKVSRLGEDLYLRGRVETAQREKKRRARRPGARAR